MKTFLTALTFVAATMAVDSGRAWEGGNDAALSGSIAHIEPRSEGFAEWSTANAYGIRCTLTNSRDSSDQRRPLRWVLDRCRPWAA